MLKEALGNSSKCHIAKKNWSPAILKKKKKKGEIYKEWSWENILLYSRVEK